MKETKEIFDSILEKAKLNLKRFNEIQRVILLHRMEIAQKSQMHLSTFAKSLASEVE